MVKSLKPEIETIAQQNKYLFEVWLNIQLSGLCRRLFQESSISVTHGLDVVTTTEKYRAMGVIK